jgi:hypothetical protein
MRILIVVALTMPLAGCFSLTAPNFSLVAPKTVPEWAMDQQAENTAEPSAKPRRNVAVRRPAPTAVQVVEQTGTISDAPTNMQPAGLGHAVVRAKPTALPSPELSARSSEPAAFSAEWQAREDARDGTLRRSMGNICRGC